MIETLIGVLAIIGVAFIFGVVLNPFFWQGLRNSKFWDEQKQVNAQDLINPDK